MTHKYYDDRHKYLSQTRLVQWCSSVPTICELNVRFGRWHSIRYLTQAEFNQFMALPEYEGPRHEAEDRRWKAAEKVFVRESEQRKEKSELQILLGE